jgi:hypothetical protein
MTPGEAATRLRAIADKIDASSQPSLAKVAADIRIVLNQIVDAGAPARQLASPGNRRISPARRPEVDVSDTRAFQEASSRVASTRR